MIHKDEIAERIMGLDYKDGNYKGVLLPFMGRNDVVKALVYNEETKEIRTSQIGVEVALEKIIEEGIVTEAELAVDVTDEVQIERTRKVIAFFEKIIPNVKDEKEKNWYQSQVVLLSDVIENVLLK